jgi:uncharacterized protein (TIGR02147 family)
MASIYEHTDYKAYLRALIKKSEERGFSTRLAEAAGCQKSYFSSSLSGKSHLLPEHIHGIANYLKLPSEEVDYFILILDYQRANGPTYRKFVLNKIHEKQNAWKDISNRLKRNSLVPTQDDANVQNYYSHYLYAVLHIAVSIPQLQTTKSLSQYLALPENVIQNYLLQLEMMGLVQKSESKWSWKSGDLHLSKDSPWIQTHHNNWRLQAMTNATLRHPESLHFSSVQSLSRKDLEALRYQMLRWIEEYRNTTGPSDPEELICFNLDLFSLGKN